MKELSRKSTGMLAYSRVSMTEQATGKAAA